MNTTKKITLIVGIFLQASTSLYADAWSDAFDVFGGPEAVYNERGSFSWTKALSIAKENGNTPELLAVGMYVSTGNPGILTHKFPGAASQVDLKNELKSILDAKNPVRKAPVIQQPVIQQPVVQQPIAPQTPTRSGWGWSSESKTAANNSQSIKQALTAQHKAEVAAATAKDKNLAAIANSGKTGISLYSAYIDSLFNLLQQAINSILDASTAAQVVQYIQNKAANLSVAASTSKYNSRTLGRMNSKKGKSKKIKSHRLSSAQ
jgi:hypothetical protein